MRQVMKTRMILLLCVLAVSPFFLVSIGEAAEIASLTEKINVESSGTAQVEITVKVAKGEPGTLLIPTSFKTAENLKIDGLPGATVALAEKEGVRVFAVSVPEAPSEKQAIKLTFSTPGFYDWKGEKITDFGNRTLQYRFMNTLPTKVLSYTMNLMLPAGFVVNTVDESQPKLTSKSPKPPYKIIRNGNQYGISIKAGKLGVGDFSMVKIRFKSEGKSTGFMVAALALCGLYLIGFRNTIRSEAGTAKT
jgi:hypothetical protein